MLIALHENDTPFQQVDIEPGHAVEVDDIASLWPFQHDPALVTDGRVIVKAAIIIEWLDIYCPGDTKFIPGGPKAALNTRFMDRFFDNYIINEMQKIVEDKMRNEDARDSLGVTRARDALMQAYGWLDGEISKQTWAHNDEFTLADCAAGPALFYADWVHPIPSEFGDLRTYRQRLLDRPSVAHVIDAARAHHDKLFPNGTHDKHGRLFSSGSAKL